MQGSAVGKYWQGMKILVIGKHAAKLKSASYDYVTEPGQAFQNNRQINMHQFLIFQFFLAVCPKHNSC